MSVAHSDLAAIVARHVDSMPTRGQVWAVEKLRGMTILTRLACKNLFDVLMQIVHGYCEHSDVLAADMYGNTCLHYFALRNNDAAYNRLLSFGLSANQKNKANETPHDVRATRRLSFIDGERALRFTAA